MYNPDKPSVWKSVKERKEKFGACSTVKRRKPEMTCSIGNTCVIFNF